MTAETGHRSSGDGTANRRSGTPVRGGRYSVGSTADFDTFDPYIGIAASVGYFPRLYNVLVNFSALDSSFRFDDLSTGYEHPDDVHVHLHHPSGREGRPEPARRAGARPCRERRRHQLRAHQDAPAVERHRLHRTSREPRSVRRRHDLHDDDGQPVRVLAQPHRQRRSTRSSRRKRSTDANIGQLEAEGSRRRPVHAQSLHRGPGRDAGPQPELLPQGRGQQRRAAAVHRRHGREDHHGPRGDPHGVPVRPALRVHGAERRRGEAAATPAASTSSARTPSTRSSRSR